MDILCCGILKKNRINLCRHPFVLRHTWYRYEIGNLLVVLCGNRDAQPVVNTGSIY